MSRVKTLKIIFPKPSCKCGMKKIWKVRNKIRTLANSVDGEIYEENFGCSRRDPHSATADIVHDDWEGKKWPKAEEWVEDVRLGGDVVEVKFEKL